MRSQRKSAGPSSAPESQRDACGTASRLEPDARKTPLETCNGASAAAANSPKRFQHSLHSEQAGIWAVEGDETNTVTSDAKTGTTSDG
eukprot:1291878-Pleurochrysis_carterae.AAC.2